MKRILIVGYGVAGRSLAGDLKANGYNVVGFIDDKPSKKGLDRLGALNDVNKVIEQHKITDIYFSIPTASASKIREFINSITDDKVAISIVPRSFKVISKETVSVRDLKDIDILHLIGRQPVKHDLVLAKERIKGKKVLITGAAGSIGSELVRQVLLLEPKELICVDFWEGGIFYLQHEVGKNKNVAFYVGNIRDEKRMEEIFEKHRPDFVFHAAAYKHVPLMQENPLEAFNNNVYGSLNMVNLAIKYKVKVFVNVSTDKAVNPVNIMGTTKRIVEILLREKAESNPEIKISSVRFGNVLESSGSVVQVFKRQLEKGEPLTVTHSRITRFFMTKEEAAQLIIQAGILSKSGEIFVLDMGEPIKVMDLAKMIVKISDKKVPIRIVGLRPGEKMYEELYFDKEDVLKTRHKQIFIVSEDISEQSTLIKEKIMKILEMTKNYSISKAELLAELSKFGFNIQAK